MGLHSRLFGSSSSSLLKLRYIFGCNSINNKPLTQIRDLHNHHHHHLKNPNSNPTTTTKFLLQRLNGNKNIDTDKEGDHYLSILSSNGKRISPEKNFYFRAPRVPPTCPFAVIGGDDNSGLSREINQHPYQITLVNSCNGLICLQDYGRRSHVIVWNPLTDDFKVIDYSSIRLPRSASNTQFECVGFGFDPESKDCKVIVRVINIYECKDKFDGRDLFDGCDSHYEVYSLKTGSWCPLRTPADDQQHPYSHPDRSVYVDGSCYWAAHASTSYVSNPTSLLSFNFANEKFSIFADLPETGKPNWSYNLVLLEYEGLVGFVHHERKGEEKNFELWVWDEEAWRKVDSFCVRGVEEPLAYWSKDKWFFRGINHELLLFDLTTKEVEHLDIYDFRHAMELIPFVESMTTLNG